MLSKYLLTGTNKIYNSLLIVWQKHSTHKMIGSALIFTFFIGLLLAELARHDAIPISELNGSINNHFFAVELAFTLLLLTELLALIFVIPRSISIAVGKQFEILSLILLRSAFKEFSYFEEPIAWGSISDPIFKMIADAFGALVIFIIVGYYYRILKRNRLTENKKDLEQFKSYKKLIALFLLVVFAMIGWMDIYNLFYEGVYMNSFNLFYTVLIFCDILIVLIAIRYTFDYFKIFRYSAFVLTTVFIRISLTAPPIINAALGIIAATLTLGLTIAFNKIVIENEEHS